MYRKCLELVLLSYFICSVIGDYGADQLRAYKNKTNAMGMTMATKNKDGAMFIPIADENLADVGVFWSSGFSDLTTTAFPLQCHAIPVLTSSNGAPVEFNDAYSSLNSNFIRNRFLMETLSHLVRERIPERVVHSKAAGAFGLFEVTNDLSNISKAKLFGPVGKQTPVAVRFSSTFSHAGEIDTKQGVRGFAIKFYTEEGNFDMVGLSNPIFPGNDPLGFQPLVHASFKNPANNLANLDALWDAITTHPNVLHTILRVFSENGTPASYQNMPGYSIHTYEFVNNQGEYSFARFHIIPDAGLKYFNATENAAASASDADYYTRLLYNDIASGQYPSWTVKLQVLSLEDVLNAEANVFDVSRELYVEDYPLHEFGRIVLNRNPENYFAQVEQIAFSPSNLVPGILGAPDKIFEARSFTYRDAQNYRLGANFDKIDVNYPFRSNLATYNRDGVPPLRDNGKDGPNYYPNNFNGPQPYVDSMRSKILSITETNTQNFDQANVFYKQLRAAEKARVIAALVANLSAITDELREKALNLLGEINTDLATSVAQGLASA